MVMTDGEEGDDTIIVSHGNMENGDDVGHIILLSTRTPRYLREGGGGSKQLTFDLFDFVSMVFSCCSKCVVKS
jgi:hypothetical protein